MTKKEEQFVQVVWDFYKAHGRTRLLWRKTKDPYKILVSEVMLQQTQVDRVIPKYQFFLERFPDVRALAKAPLSEVLLCWQGLGYNRRAKLLHKCAQTVVNLYDAVFPKDYAQLCALPGIGSYTAHAVLAFAYNRPEVLIETNVRAVFLHHFFKDAHEVPDTAILAVVARTLQADKPRLWYYALMDYGSYLKRQYGNPNIRSKHYTKQSRFEGSDRQIRGALIRELGKHAQTRRQLLKTLSKFEDIRVDAQLFKLLAEEMVAKKRQRYQLPS